VEALIPLERTPFPVEWERIRVERMRLYRRMPEPTKGGVAAHIPVFLAEKRFYGWAGLR